VSYPIAQLSEDSVYTTRPAAELAFVSPVTVAASDTPDTSREAREPSAFVGYDEQTTTYFSIHTQDRQCSNVGSGIGHGGIGTDSSCGNGYHDSYERQTYIDTYGARYR
jgi:hypothetical protein